MTKETSLESITRQNAVSKHPWIPVSVQMHDHSMTVAGVPAKTYYWDAETFVRTYQDVGDYYGIDIVSPFADQYNFEIEAMGGKMIYGENVMPTIDFRDPLIKKPEDLKKLKTPDFYRDARLPYALNTIRIQRENQGRFCGVFSMAVGMRGYPALIKDIRKRPEFAHELFTFIIDRVLVPYFEVQKEFCGISFTYGVDAWACIPNLSVKEMKKWVVPYNRQLAEKAAAIGIKAVTGSGDYCEEDPVKFDVEVVHGAFDIQMASRGGNALTLGMGVWHNYPLEPVREYTAEFRGRGDTISIRAGINARLLRDGPVDRIVGAVKRYIDMLARDHEVTIWLANIPADTPADHVHAAVAAAHIYGRLPIPENLDSVEFKLPDRESFEEWEKKQAKNPA